MHSRIHRWLCCIALVASASPAVAAKADIIEIDGSVRVRETILLNHDFDRDAGDANNFATLRARVGIAASVGQYASTFIQFQDSRVLGEPMNTVTSLEQVDLHEVFIHIHDALESTEFKLGRMEMAYGQHRQIGNLGWHDNGRSFDGVIIQRDLPDFGWIHFFAMKTLETGGFVAGVNSGTGVTRDPDSTNPETAFLGAYLHYDASDETVLEAYLLDNYTDGGSVRGANDENPTDVGGNRFTAGGRVRHRVQGDTSYQVYAEGALQFGTNPEYLDESLGEVVPGENISAFAATAGGRYDFTGETNGWVSAEFNLASGDDGTSDDDQTYHQLFPTGHRVLGAMDFVGWQNITAVELTAGISPDETWNLSGSFHLFRLNDPADAWYNAAGNVMNGLYGAPEFDSALGNEIDITLTFQPEESLRFLAQVGFWMPGSWIEQAYALHMNGGDVDDALANPASLDGAITGYLMTTVDW